MRGLSILLAAGRGEPAHELLLDTARPLGLGLANPLNLLNLLNPEIVVIGGWAGIAIAEKFLPEIVAAVREYTLPHIDEQAQIEMCRLGPEAVAFGAATLPVTALLTSGDPRAPCLPRPDSRVIGGVLPVDREAVGGST